MKLRHSHIADVLRCVCSSNNSSDERFTLPTTSDSTWRPNTDISLTTYRPFTDHIPITYRPPEDQIPISCQLHIDHFIPTTCRPNINPLPTTYRPLPDHLKPTYRFLADQISTTYGPLTDNPMTKYRPLSDHTPLLTPYLSPIQVFTYSSFTWCWIQPYKVAYESLHQENSHPNQGLCCEQEDVADFWEGAVSIGLSWEINMKGRRRTQSGTYPERETQSEVRLNPNARRNGCTREKSIVSKRHHAAEILRIWRHYS